MHNPVTVDLAIDIEVESSSVSKPASNPILDPRMMNCHWGTNRKLLAITGTLQFVEPKLCPPGTNSETNVA